MLKFIQMAKDTGFVVILRAGPYVCAEHEFGGLPWWLLTPGVNTVIPRSNDKIFMAAAERWFDELLPKFLPYLYKNGGPIITVQVRVSVGLEACVCSC